MLLLAYQLNRLKDSNYRYEGLIYQMKELPVEEQEGVIHLSILLEKLEKSYAKKQ